MLKFCLFWVNILSYTGILHYWTNFSPWGFIFFLFTYLPKYVGDFPFLSLKKRLTNIRSEAIALRNNCSNLALSAHSSGRPPLWTTLFNVPAALGTRRAFPIPAAPVNESQSTNHLLTLQYQKRFTSSSVKDFWGNMYSSYNFFTYT